MARKTVTTLEDDFDGSEAVGTFQFSFGADSYEIDLNQKNADKLLKGLAPFIDHGRKQAGQRRVGKPGKSGSRSTADRKNSAEIRAWAREEGIEISERGRIPASVIEQYESR